jgi:GxxExxY protein
MEENEITKAIDDAAFKVHTTLGPGLLESVYQAALVHELRKKWFALLVEHPIPVIYDNVRLEIGYIADLVVEEKVIVELKSVKQIAPVHLK